MSSLAMSDQALSFYRLRCMGFRLDSTHVDNKPHMVCLLGGRLETSLEISECVYPGKWTVWLRSDLAGSRTRFCYLRTVERCNQVGALILAITDASPAIELRDEAEFHASLAMEAADCKRRYREYCRDARWPRVPGG